MRALGAECPVLPLLSKQQHIYCSQISLLYHKIISFLSTDNNAPTASIPLSSFMDKSFAERRPLSESSVSDVIKHVGVLAQTVKAGDKFGRFIVYSCLSYLSNSLWIRDEFEEAAALEAQYKAHSGDLINILLKFIQIVKNDLQCISNNNNNDDGHAVATLADTGSAAFEEMSNSFGKILQKQKEISFTIEKLVIICIKHTNDPHQVMKLQETMPFHRYQSTIALLLHSSLNSSPLHSNNQIDGAVNEVHCPLFIKDFFNSLFDLKFWSLKPAVSETITSIIDLALHNICAKFVDILGILSETSNSEPQLNDSPVRDILHDVDHQISIIHTYADLLVFSFFGVEKDTPEIHVCTATSDNGAELICGETIAIEKAIQENQILLTGVLDSYGKNELNTKSLFEICRHLLMKVNNLDALLDEYFANEATDPLMICHNLKKQKESLQGFVETSLHENSIWDINTERLLQFKMAKIASDMLDCHVDILGVFRLGIEYCSFSPSSPQSKKSPDKNRLSDLDFLGGKHHNRRHSSSSIDCMSEWSLDDDTDTVASSIHSDIIPASGTVIIEQSQKSSTFTSAKSNSMRQLIADKARRSSEGLHTLFKRLGDVSIKTEASEPLIKTSRTTSMRFAFDRRIWVFVQQLNNERDSLILDIPKTDLRRVASPTAVSDQIMKAISAVNLPSPLTDSSSSKTGSLKRNEISIMSADIRAGTLEKLVERATWFDEIDSKFLSDFVYSSPLFVLNDKLFASLQSRYFYFPSWKATLSKDIADLITEQIEGRVKMRVFQFCKLWIEVHAADFWENEELMNKMNEFIEQDMYVDMPRNAMTLRKLLQNRNIDAKYSDTMYLLEAPQPILPKKMSPIHLLDVDSLEVARQLTLIDYSLYSKIPLSEFVKKNSPHLNEIVHRFNVTTHWVVTEILCNKFPKDRALIIKHFIKIANKCLFLNNLNSCKSILGGLQCVAIHRLRKSWMLVSKKYQLLLEHLERIMSSDDNYKNLRERIALMKPPGIPWLGLYQRDLTFVMDAHPTEISIPSLSVVNNSNSLPLSPSSNQPYINFQKCRLVAAVLKEIHLFQRTSYCLHTIIAIQKYLQNEKGYLKTDADQFKLSVMLEPKE